MKKTVLTFGLISGAVMSAMMLATVPFMDRIGFDHGMLIGYTSMILAFMLVFFGIRSYRDNQCGGQISFGKAFTVGFCIMLIACVCYVVTWEALYFTVLNDFTDKYAAYTLDKARRSGATDAAIQKLTQQMADFKRMYQNPFFNVAMTFIEPFPVGLLVTLLSAGFLRKKAPGQPAAAAAQSA